ncbi:MAG: NADH-quinone oxidoreductase subunit NuoF [Methanobacterium sp.]|uniref:NADH-ubiquinone oxidoreductase-F iron-sulfur binding region domain-containing protein n=1 Tax=Methanobacterium sp. TaxID=2164 RepID=UPI003D64589E|nr:NADH-quinone oxidoreductase subunit NuoF [Methanobacterium sp.]
MNFNKITQKAKEEYNSLYEREDPLILIGSATCGNSAGASALIPIIEETLEDHDLKAEIMEVGCIGICYVEPIITVFKKGKPGIFYGNITPKIATKIVESYLINDDPLPEHALGTVGKGEIQGINSFFDMPVLKPQVRKILRHCGFIDPKNIDHYIANEGYSGFINALKLKPEEIIEKLKESGLRGRGGAGFPTWMKWQFCIDSEADTKYLICNADEGDPGAFMNRSLLESDPHSVLEGILIGGYVTGAKNAYIYCRAEYPLALERLKHALVQMREYGFLGKNINNSGFNFDIEIKEGAGAFVCGEETALIASIEGKRGTPRTRPPFPTTSGLWGKPTVINNVETFASVAFIMQESPGKFAEYGTDASKGTKTFSLVGQVKNTGLIEVPLGTTLREVIFDIGGGILDDGEFKAVQIGGPSGGCLTEEFIDTPIDYDSLVTAGAIMGSGGLVVMDQSTCMVDVAQYFLGFIQKESCGKCVPCRLGTKQMLDILGDITEGKGHIEDIALLMELAEGIKEGSLCALGGTSPNPVLTTLNLFKDEYDAHINEKICPSLVCKNLISYNIIQDKCNGCMLCLKSCPVNAISGEKKEPHTIDQSKCVKCGTCIDLCSKADAVECISKPKEDNEDNNASAII